MSCTCWLFGKRASCMPNATRVSDDTPATRTGNSAVVANKRDKPERPLFEHASDAREQQSPAGADLLHGGAAAAETGDKPQVARPVGFGDARPHREQRELG